MRKLKWWMIALAVLVLAWFLFRDRVLAIWETIMIVVKRRGSIDKAGALTEQAADTVGAGLKAAGDWFRSKSATPDDTPR